MMMTMTMTIRRLEPPGTYRCRKNGIISNTYLWALVEALLRTIFMYFITCSSSRQLSESVQYPPARFDHLVRCRRYPVPKE